MKEVYTKRTSLQATLNKAYQEYQESTVKFESFEDSAAKLGIEITSKSQEVRRLLNDKREADLLALRSEINFKKLELMSLEALLQVKLKNPNSDNNQMHYTRKYRAKNPRGGLARFPDSSNSFVSGNYFFLVNNNK